MQGFGIGGGLGTAAPAPFVSEDLSTLSPTSQPTPTAIPTLRLSYGPTISPSSAKATTLQPTALPTNRSVTSPPPTPLSTGGNIAVSGDLPYPLNFDVQFQIQAGDLTGAIGDLKELLTTYLTTLELSMDAEWTEGPVQVVGLEITEQGMLNTMKNLLSSNCLC